MPSHSASPRMTRQHFQFIVETIATADSSDLCKREMALAFSRRLKATNPSFDVDRFLDAADLALHRFHQSEEVNYDA